MKLSISSHPFSFSMKFVAQEHQGRTLLSHASFVLESSKRWELVGSGDLDTCSSHLIAWLEKYFIGVMTPLPPVLYAVSPFTQAVLEGIAAIPFGKTLSYKELAILLGIPTKVRALASACGRNPLPLLIGCHRVIASDGTLGGFSAEGGVALKKELQRFEKSSSLT